MTAKRVGYFDVLRILSAFFVIVNHTNSPVFQGSNPSEGLWFVSLTWYYVSKMAVPLFVMITGACLLPKQDSYAKVMGRIVRMVLVILVFSYGYYLVDAWINYGLFPRILEWKTFLALIIHAPLVDAFWYLYFYVGLLLILPMLQRFVKGASKKDLRYAIALPLLLQAVLPLFSHYVEAINPSGYLMVLIPSVYMGLLFAGHYLHQYGQKRGAWLWVLVLVTCVAGSVLLTYDAYQQQFQPYWFMDNRLMPSILIIGSAVSVFMLAKSVCKTKKKWITTLGGLSFGVYLMHTLIIDQTQARLYVPMLAHLPVMVSMVLWEVVIFAISLLIAWILSKLPLIKKLV